MLSTSSARRPPARPPVNLRSAGIQIGVVGFALVILGMIVATTVANLASRGIPIGFDFLWARAGFTISESVLSYTPDDSNLWAIMVGIGNTIFASSLVIIVSTIAGTLLGIARLSVNPLVAALAKVWVETARNTPLLLLLLFVYTIWWTLPADVGGEIVPGVYASMRGLVVPWLEMPWDGRMTALSVMVALAVLVAARMAASRAKARTGRRPSYLPVATTVTLLTFVLVFVVAGGSLDWPEVRGTALTGGITLTPETATLLLGLMFYTTGFIAEIVRSGLNAVPKGQWEASRSLGLPTSRILRLIIIPQMMRVIVPPMTSQYINVVKNSTLAMAVGYNDFMVVMGTIINKTSRAVEGTVLIIITYLVINLTVSFLMNLYNRRVMIKER
ncbi:amino acid ABC transporter permease [Sphingomonas sp. CCH21-G11]|jgi:general L-amino acid transport system permease protein|uniref:amino acid ABC transporter permease n=1 Tax=Sphingomonas sp. CCH21-G11 TaxID=1768749 RepID=UPI00082EDCF2|nr:ABC transporter permease subunit [Sphingomonas sp. CCH21-G11]